MRRKYVVANWKMHTTITEAGQLAKDVLKGAGTELGISVILCPPYPYLAVVGQILKRSSIAMGAQNLYPASEGAFTGEVSPAMLLDLGCKCVILGHSERRHVLGESDEFINQKVRFALDAGLSVILCVGETLQQRQTNQTQSLLEHQITEGLAGVPQREMAQLSIAYEPVWAIGNATHHATPQQAQDAHSIIRHRLSQLFGDEVAQTTSIQYGGSVKPDNAASFFSRDGVDGALIGGASLHADQFLAIIQSAIHQLGTERQNAAKGELIPV